MSSGGLKIGSRIKPQSNGGVIVLVHNKGVVVIQEQPHYAFSEKYDPEHARKYFEKHESGFWRRLSNWREVGMARKALEIAGNPLHVLDLPCGTGRFWPMLLEAQPRRLWVADNSRAMLDVGMTVRPGDITSRIERVEQCSAFATGLPDKVVDCVFCIRLLHHIGESADRILILKEFARLSRETVIVSLWVDGNYRAYRYRKQASRRARERGEREYTNRFLLQRNQIEQDFAAAGLQVVGAVDFLKYWDKWRAYVLRVSPASSV